MKKYVREGKRTSHIKKTNYCHTIEISRQFVSFRCQYVAIKSYYLQRRFRKSTYIRTRDDAVGSDVAVKNISKTLLPQKKTLTWSVPHPGNITGARQQVGEWGSVVFSCVNPSSSSRWRTNLKMMVIFILSQTFFVFFLWKHRTKQISCI